LNIGLENDIQLFDIAGLDLGIEIFQRHFAGLGEFRFALFALPELRHLTGLRLIGYGDERVARLGNALETENLDRK
jgi:hypothetical protein